MIASGCPTRTEFHSPFIAEMALDMIESVQIVKDESKDPPESLRIRVGNQTLLHIFFIKLTICMNYKQIKVLQFFKYKNIYNLL